MSGERIVVTGTTKTLASAGALIANNALAQAAASYDIVTDGSSYPDAEFVLSFTFSVAPIEGTVLALYARPLDIDGTGDAEIPETTRPTRMIGYIAVNNVTTLQYASFTAAGVPRKAEYYLHNAGTGQSVSTGWTLKVTPLSEKLAP